MQSIPFILFPGNGVWRIAAAAGTPLTEVVADAVPAAAAAAVAGALTAGRYRSGDAVMLALPSAWCLCAAVAVGDLPSRGRRQALTYRLEEKLPVSAEDVVADFVPGAGDGDVLGVCVQTRQLRPLVEALDAAGIGVQSISPASLLALQHRVTGGSGSANEVPVELLLWGGADGQTLELFVIEYGRPAAWYVLPDDANDLSMHLSVEAASRGFPADGTPVPLRSVGVRQELLDALALPPGVRIVQDKDATAPETHTAAAGRDVLAGRVEPWVELRRDALAGGRGLARVRSALAAAGVAAAALVLVASIAMLWRAGRYDEAARQDSDAQRDLFRQVLPGRQAPPDVRSRLAAEARGLRALRGDPSDDRDAPPAVAAPAAGLVALRDVIARLPRDVRFRVLEVRFDGPKFWLDGQARSHGDADAIAAALREGGLCNVEPPRTEQLDGETTAVSFSIAGTVNATAPEPVKSGKRKLREGRS